MLNYTIVLEIGLVAAVTLLTLFIVFRFRQNKNISSLKASMTVEEIENHAKRIALDHSISSKRSISNWPFGRMNDNYNYILSLYKDLNNDVNQKRAVPPASEWLLDNFYVIEEQVKSIRRDLSKKNYFQLPVLKNGQFKGYTRFLPLLRNLCP